MTSVVWFVIYRGFLYSMTNSGYLRKIDKETGRVRWRRRLGQLAAATPAVGDGSVYVTILERERGVNKGRVAALDAERIGRGMPVATRRALARLHLAESPPRRSA